MYSYYAEVLFRVGFPPARPFHPSRRILVHETAEGKSHYSTHRYERMYQGFAGHRRMKIVPTHIRTHHPVQNQRPICAIRAISQMNLSSRNAQARKKVEGTGTPSTCVVDLTIHSELLTKEGKQVHNIHATEPPTTPALSSALTQTWNYIT